jgi:hypothetical protein
MATANGVENLKPKVFHNKQLSMTRSMYFNPSGPGDYSLPPLIGRKNVESKKKNVPSFGFGTKHGSQSVVSKDHLVVRHSFKIGLLWHTVSRNYLQSKNVIN